jgi:hypothetical protein
MDRRRWTLPGRIAAFVGFAIAGVATVASAADPPTYRTIAPMDARQKRGEMRYPSQVQPLPRQPYAWGWFGARPRSQPSWQRGYYNDLRYWSRNGW